MSLVDAIFPPTQFGRALLVLLAAVVTLAVVWIFQWAGYAPCELCLVERYAFYAALPVGAAAASLARAGKHGWARAGLALLALIFLANAVFAFYHVGVEQKWWQGPTACTGSLSGPVDLSNLAKAVNSGSIVRCDEPALRLLGLSLAAWDVVASAALAIYAGLAARLAR
jgi:disulfide bond formation protein DsbB